MKSGPCYQLASRAGGLPHREIMDLYRLGMAEAKRILMAGGTLWVKCADELESSRPRRGHIEVFQVAQRLGLEDEDLFILMQETAPVARTGRKAPPAAGPAESRRRAGLSNRRNH